MKYFFPSPPIKYNNFNIFLINIALHAARNIWYRIYISDKCLQMLAQTHMPRIKKKILNIYPFIQCVYAIYVCMYKKRGDVPCGIFI